MRIAATTSRFGLVLAVLLVLFGVSTAVAAANGTEDARQPRSSVVGESASAAPPTYNGLEDLRHSLLLSTGTLRSPATTLLETGWAVCTRVIGEYAPPEWLLVGEVDSTAMVAVTPTPQSSRAPPFA